MSTAPGWATASRCRTISRTTSGRPGLAPPRAAARWRDGRPGRRPPDEVRPAGTTIAPMPTTGKGLPRLPIRVTCPRAEGCRLLDRSAPADPGGRADESSGDIAGTVPVAEFARDFRHISVWMALRMATRTSDSNSNHPEGPLEPHRRDRDRVPRHRRGRGRLPPARTRRVVSRTAHPTERERRASRARRGLDAASADRGRAGSGAHQRLSPAISLPCPSSRFFRPRTVQRTVPGGGGPSTRRPPS